MADAGPLAVGDSRSSRVLRRRVRGWSPATTSSSSSCSSSSGRSRHCRLMTPVRVTSGIRRIGVWVADFDGTLTKLASLGSPPLSNPVGPVGTRRGASRNPDGVYVEIMESDPLSGSELASARSARPIAVRSVTLSVPDLARSVTFFRGLGLEHSSAPLRTPGDEALRGLDGTSTRGAVLSAGGVLVEIVEYLDPRGAPARTATGSAIRASSTSRSAPGTGVTTRPCTTEPSPQAAARTVGPSASPAGVWSTSTARTTSPWSCCGCPGARIGSGASSRALTAGGLRVANKTSDPRKAVPDGCNRESQQSGHGLRPRHRGPLPHRHRAATQGRARIRSRRRGSGRLCGQPPQSTSRELPDHRGRAGCAAHLRRGAASDHPAGRARGRLVLDGFGGERGRRRGHLRCRHRVVHGRRLPACHRSSCGSRVLDAGWLAYNIAGFGFVAWIAIITVATLRHDALPRWSAWLAIPIAVINFVGPFAVEQGSGAFSPQGWFAMVVALTFAVWLLAVAIAAGRPARAPRRLRRLRSSPDASEPARRHHAERRRRDGPRQHDRSPAPPPGL